MLKDNKSVSRALSDWLQEKVDGAVSRAMVNERLDDSERNTYDDHDAECRNLDKC